MTLEQFVMEAQENLHISKEAASFYVKAREVLLEEVNSSMLIH